jgi:hypothetical protein
MSFSEIQQSVGQTLVAYEFILYSEMRGHKAAALPPRTLRSSSTPYTDVLVSSPAKMPTNDDFMSFRDNLGTISIDGEDFTESNIEDMESDPEAETSMAIDYWFGKMYLKCTIAEEVLRDPIDGKSLEAADVGQFLPL